MIVYMMRNKINGMSYVGATKHRIEERLARHWYDAFIQMRNAPMPSAIREFGKDAFDVLILGVAECREEMDEMEKHFIREHNTMAPNGYNVTSGGRGTPGRKWSESNRAKQQWRKNYSQESRVKMSIHNHMRKPIEVGGVIYHSMRAAARALGITTDQIYYRVRHNKPLLYLGKEYHA